jgi:DNA repair protein RadA/Sms
MARPRTSYICKNCGHSEVRWFGRCPQCNEFNTAEESAPSAERAGPGLAKGSVPAAEFQNLAEVSQLEHARLSSGIDELDRVLGGGLVPGSYLVLAGEPGAGKTTMASEMMLQLVRDGRQVAYVSGEESTAQARLRFERLGADFTELALPISIETSVERVAQAIADNTFDLIVVDSVQTMFSEAVPGAPGSVSQVRECGYQLMQAAKTTGTSVLLIGQVTKGGEMAGPRTLEHMVDVVLAFEGDRKEQYRILRAVKNRFGSTDEIGVFEMTATGLAGIADPSQLFLGSGAALPGAATTAIIEGTRPVLCEIQALVTPSNLPQPVRASTGIDPRRTQMLLAVMSRKAGYRLGSMDVFINVAGGLKITEPAADLAVCLAVASALEGRPTKAQRCAFAEVSLLGEVRSAPQSERRRREAERLGYTAVILDGGLRQVLQANLDQRSVDETLVEDE